MLKKIDEKNVPKKTNKESNRERFVRIVERRVNLLIKNLDSLGKCANKRNYEYSEKDVKKIFGEIDKKTREIKAMFAGKSTASKGFKLE
jgi:hypothetical protein